MPNHDPFRWTDVLRKIAQSSVAETLRQGNSTNDSDPAVAYLWTETVGKCLLFGIDVEESCQINSQVATLALACGKRFVQDSIRDLEEIEDDIATSDTQLEIDEYVCSPLEERMDYWAVTIAAEEALRESHTSDAWKPLLEFVDIVEQFDDGLESKIDDICHAANTNLLSNWTDLLDSKYADSPPWWLDGRLEKQRRQLAIGIDPPLRCGSSTMVRAFSLVGAPVESNEKVAFKYEAELEIAAAGSAQRNTHGELSWSHPDGSVKVSLRKPRRLRKESKREVCLEFGGQPEAASQLIDKMAEWGTASAIIEKTSIGMVQAKFTYEDLIQQVEAGNHDLIVDGVLWVFLGNS